MVRGGLGWGLVFGQEWGYVVRWVRGGAIS